MNSMERMVSYIKGYATEAPAIILDNRSGILSFSNFCHTSLVHQVSPRILNIRKL